MILWAATMASAVALVTAAHLFGRHRRAGRLGFHPFTEGLWIAGSTGLQVGSALLLLRAFGVFA